MPAYCYSTKFSIFVEIWVLLRLDILDEAYFKFNREIDKNRRRVSERESVREVQTFDCGERKSIILLEGPQASSACVSDKSTTKLKTSEVAA